MNPIHQIMSGIQAFKNTLFGLLSLLLMPANGFSQHTWILQEIPTAYLIYSADFITEQTGIAVGENGTILRTTDGGNTWNQIWGSYWNWFNGVAFADSNKVIIVGSGGMVLKSSDQGVTWTTVTIPGVTYDLNAIAINKVSGFGVITGQTNAVITTSDFGETWTIIQDGYMSDFFAADVFPGSGGVVIGWNSIFQPLLGYSFNGLNWDYQNFYPTWGGVMYEGVARGGKFSSIDKGFVVGNYFIPGGGFIAPFGGWTNNSWTAQSFPVTLKDIDYQDNYAVTVGNNGYIAESTDGGLTWTMVNLNFNPPHLNSVILTGNTGYITGEGVILKRNSTVSITGPEKIVLNLYPNPCTDMITIDLAEADPVQKIECLDLNGKALITCNGDGKTGKLRLDVKLLPKGMYLIRLQQTQSIITGHFIKK